MKNQINIPNSLSGDAIERIKNYDMSFVFDKLIYDEKITEEDVAELETEFKKFMMLTALGVYPIAMISPLVDEVWHQFILFTSQYRKFCMETLGFFINHTPDTPKTPIPTESGQNFRVAYEQNFGPVPNIWYKQMDKASLDYYAQQNLVGRPPKLWSGWAGPEEI